MASGGYGRGGRGAALLQALNQPVRKPGQPGPEGDASNVSGAKPELTTPGMPAVTPTQAPPIRMGRGSHLAGLLQSGQLSGPLAQPTPGALSGPPAQLTPAALPQSSAGVVGAVQPAPVQPGIQPAAPRPMGRGLAAMQALLQASGRGARMPVAQQPTVPAPETQSSPPAQQRPASTPSPPSSSSSASSHTPEPPTKQQEEPPTRQMGGLDIGDRRPTVHNSGTDGKPISLSANYIRVKCHNKGVYQYHVGFSPIIDSPNMRFKMVSDHHEVLGKVKAFDGTILYLPKKLQETTILHSTRITDGADITLTIRLTKILPPESCTQLYNIIFRRIMKILKMCQVGRYYYNPNTPSAVPQHKLEIWPGYITAISEQEGGLMLLADASHRVLRTETVLDLMRAIVQKNKVGFQDEITKTLVGTIVLTRYNNKTYRIDDIMWEKNPKDTFASSSGEQMSFLDYYKKHYNKTISDWEQPLLLHRPKKKDQPGGRGNKLEVICLIPELAFMTGLTDEMRKDFRVMKDIATHTRVTPMQRQKAMATFVNNVMETPDANKQLEDWGLQLDMDTIQLEGRQLQPERIVLRDKKITTENADWSRDVTRNRVICAVDIRHWIVLYTKRDASKANDFISAMLSVCPNMGIDVSPPVQFELRDDRTETFIRSLRENINPKVQLAVIIFPTSRDDRYSAVKKLCCVECPIPSQVIIAKTISQQQKLRSVTQKVALQITCKLGGELWAVDIPMKNIMVVGIDVYHDATRGKRSIAGFVSSTNNTLTRWYSRVCIQMPNQELIDGLKLCMISGLRKYYDVNHGLPERIIVYRDGVGDGMLKTVSEHEVEQLMTCFHHFGEGYQPKFAVVIVQKRINTRLFLKVGRNQLENPPPGTVMDHTVTRRDWYDFFLVSQHVRQGTVSPTHYIIVCDEAGLKPDHMQRLTYKMTHMYYNWAGTVRVPAPCQYAHKLAYLVGQNIHKETSPELSDRLFFL